MHPAAVTSTPPARLAEGDARIVLLSELFPPAIGGSAVLLDNVYRRIAGSTPTVICNRPDRLDPWPGAGAYRLVRIPMVSVEWGLMNLPSLRRHLRVAAALRRECRRPAVVHCGRALPEGLTALLVRRLAGGPPFLCWTHGEELETASDSRELRLLLAAVHRAAAAVVANCRNTATRLQQMGVPPARIHIVYPGVDAERFSNGRGGQALRARFVREGELLVLTVARLQRRKGHDFAIRAIAALRDTNPGLRYLIVGDGDERESLERLARDCGVADRVSFVGAVADAALPDYYAAADIFLHPNRVDNGDVEGFGIVFLEAAAAGLPVIGGGSGGVPEAVAQGSTGLLVSGADVAELASAIRTLAGSPALRRGMGEAGRVRVRDRFTWSRAAHDVLAIHRAVGAAR